MLGMLLGFPSRSLQRIMWGHLGNTTRTAEDQMDQKMENAMRAGFIFFTPWSGHGRVKQHRN